MVAPSWDRGTQTIQSTKSIFLLGPLEKKVVDLFLPYQDIPGNLDFLDMEEMENWRSKDLCFWIYDNAQERPFLGIITNHDSGA